MVSYDPLWYPVSYYDILKIYNDFLKTEKLQEEKDILVIENYENALSLL